MGKPAGNNRKRMTPESTTSSPPTTPPSSPVFTSPGSPSSPPVFTSPGSPSPPPVFTSPSSPPRLFASSGSPPPPPLFTSPGFPIPPPPPLVPDEDIFGALSPFSAEPSQAQPEPLAVIIPRNPVIQDWVSYSSLEWFEKYRPPLPSPDSKKDGFLRYTTIRRRYPSPEPPSYDTYREPFFPSIAETTDATSSPSSKLGAGIRNLGNTCFLASILQCFTHTVPLVHALRSSTHESCGSGAFCVACALRELVDASLASSGGSVSPRKFVRNLNNISDSFKGSEQQDAHEFMQGVLDKLRRCFADREDNIVENIFGGRLISNLRCCNCGHSSDTYEPVLDLSLEIENVTTLLLALESFTKVEKINENFKCDVCGEKLSTEKRLLLDQTPLVAALHLKRFNKDVQKITNHVIFTLELDLQPYTSGISNDDNVPLKYDLYAVVVHVGPSYNSGHYFCFVRSAPDMWHKMNDSKVKCVPSDVVLSQEAYILFYARKGTPWFSSIMEEEKAKAMPVAESKLDFKDKQDDDDRIEEEKAKAIPVADSKPDYKYKQDDDDGMEEEKAKAMPVADSKLDFKDKQGDGDSMEEDKAKAMPVTDSKLDFKDKQDDGDRIEEEKAKAMLVAEAKLDSADKQDDGDSTEEEKAKAIPVKDSKLDSADKQDDDDGMEEEKAKAMSVKDSKLDSADKQDDDGVEEEKAKAMPVKDSKLHYADKQDDDDRMEEEKKICSELGESSYSQE
ncbi:ubiquitin carboxyl-terminal hydrolase 21-like [Abrus precatorius]|uniref:Ubiquitin carboxyl-terminal hydrolase n=1 Tax=Abrus precatorius TaxID=3816 RepID=A0A8B8L0C2_ABRPR|nr:ubiquitin carboxyl-terminal hydrolase 21-like [Abrus precatorius]